MFRFLLFSLFATTGVDASSWKIPYTVDKPGQVSLAVYTKDGKLLRELLRGQPKEAGTHQASWDGLDRYGNAMPPGEYMWKLLQNDGFRAEYLLSLGVNPKSAPYDPWVGNHQPATALLVDPNGFMYAGSSIAENAPTLLRQTLDGKKVFWHNIGSRRHGPVSALAWSGNRLVQFSIFRKVHLRNPQTGSEMAQFDVRQPDMPELHFGVLPKGVDAKKLGFAEYRELVGRLRKKYFGGLPAHMTANDKVFVVSELNYDLIRWFDVETGKVIGTLNISKPVGLAMTPEGVLYAISEDQIVRFSEDTYTDPKELVPSGVLKNPVRLAWDRTDGSLWVAHGEERANQVSRLSPEGKVLATFGCKGGRKFGPYVGEDFYNIVDIAADGKGGFLVAESGGETFRRTGNFSRQGKLLNEWHGGQKWGSFVAFDSGETDRIMFNAGDDIKALADVDYASRTYRVTHVLRAPDTKDLMPSLTAHSSLWQLQRRNGELYLVNAGGNAASTAPAIYRADLDSGLVIPVARSCNLNPSQIWDFKANVLKEGIPRYWEQALKQRGIKMTRRFVLDGKWSGYSWSDDNGNGKIDMEEVEIGPSRGYNTLSIDEDWNLLLAGGSLSSKAHFIFKVLNRNTSDKPPRWSWADAVAIERPIPGEFSNMGATAACGVHQDKDGSLYLLAKGNAHPGDDKQGETWPACNLGSVRLLKWNAAGELDWNVGRAASINASLPGEIHEPMRILGMCKGNLVVQDRVIRLAQVFTSDGLYAGDFLQGRVEDGLPPEIYHTSTKAHQPGLFLHDHIASVMHVTTDGEVLFNPSGRNGAPVYRIHGWDGWKRQSGTFSIDAVPNAATRQGTGLSGFYFSNTNREGKPVLKRVDKELWFGNRTLPATQDKSGRPWYGNDQPFQQGMFSARWEGKIEVQFSEAFQFFVESEYGSQVKLWIDGQEIISEQQMPLHRGKPAPHLKGRTMSARSEPIPLKPGTQYPIRLEYVSGGNPSQLHLVWESFSQERQHLPTEFLYHNN